MERKLLDVKVCYFSNLAEVSETGFGNYFLFECADTEKSCWMNNTSKAPQCVKTCANSIEEYVISTLQNINDTVASKVHELKNGTFDAISEVNQNVITTKYIVNNLTASAKSEINLTIHETQDLILAAVLKAKNDIDDALLSVNVIMQNADKKLTDSNSKLLDELNNLVKTILKEIANVADSEILETERSALNAAKKLESAAKAAFRNLKEGMHDSLENIQNSAQSSIKDISSSGSSAAKDIIASAGFLDSFQSNPADTLLSSENIKNLKDSVIKNITTSKNYLETATDDLLDSASKNISSLDNLIHSITNDVSDLSNTAIKKITDLPEIMNKLDNGGKITNNVEENINVSIEKAMKAINDELNYIRKLIREASDNGQFKIGNHTALTMADIKNATQTAGSFMNDSSVSSESKFSNITENTITNISGAWSNIQSLIMPTTTLSTTQAAKPTFTGCVSVFENSLLKFESGCHIKTSPELCSGPSIAACESKIYC